MYKSPVRREAIIFTNAEVVNWTLNTLQWNFNRSIIIFIGKMLLKILSGNCRLFCAVLNDVLTHCPLGHVAVMLTHWGRGTQICVCKIIIIDSDDGLAPGRRQAIMWNNAGILLTGPLRTKFSEIWIGIEMSSSKKMHLKMSSTTWHPFCLGLNV